MVRNDIVPFHSLFHSSTLHEIYEPGSRVVTTRWSFRPKCHSVLQMQSRQKNAFGAKPVPNDTNVKREW